jgi:phosphoenolpyruvate synthase/pyruvate phosphate dikinase
MKLVKGLIKKNLKKIRSKRWYHQRFDGSPHFLTLISLAELIPEARKMGCHFHIHFGLFEHDKADWYIDLDDINRVSKRIIKLGMKKSHFTKKLMRNWRKDQRNFYKFCHTLNKINLKKLSNQELKEIYEKYIALDLKFVSSSSIIDGFALGTDELIQRELIKLLKKKKLERETSRYFSVLTGPIHHSFINEAEIGLLKIADQVAGILYLAKLFKKRPVIFLRKIVKKYPKIYRLLKNQEKYYFWCKNNYVHNNYIDVNKWVSEIKAVFLSGINIEERINQIVNTPKRNLKEKNILIQFLNPAKKLRVLLEISEDFTYWQDERKKQTYWSTHYGSILLMEIGRRFGFDLHQMKYCYPDEVVSFFAEPIVNKKEIKARLKKCFWYQEGQEDYEVITEHSAHSTYRRLFEKKSLKAVNDFRGLSACRGVARGPVKIVKSSTETNKLKEGDVLVAVMTRPDYIAGMKKASAIVTNEGGVTCHAAIVSRELNIPCVIGTKIATEVLKDGDIVEVNGNHGVVTVIKRSK